MPARKLRYFGFHFLSRASPQFPVFPEHLMELGNRNFKQLAGSRGRQRAKPAVSPGFPPLSSRETLPFHRFPVDQLSRRETVGTLLLLFLSLFFSRMLWARAAFLSLEFPFCYFFSPPSFHFPSFLAAELPLFLGHRVVFTLRPLAPLESWIFRRCCDFLSVSKQSRPRIVFPCCSDAFPFIWRIWSCFLVVLSLKQGSLTNYQCW